MKMRILKDQGDDDDESDKFLTILTKFLTILNNFLLPTYRLINDPNPRIRILILLAQPRTLKQLKLYQLHYLIIGDMDNRKILKYRPEEIILDDQEQRYTTNQPHQRVKTTCISSWKSHLQRWCFGNLALVSTTTKACIIQPLPQDNSVIRDDCYQTTEMTQT